jgi:hypothetical protein
MSEEAGTPSQQVFCYILYIEEVLFGMQLIEYFITDIVRINIPSFQYIFYCHFLCTNQSAIDIFMFNTLFITHSLCVGTTLFTLHNVSFAMLISVLNLRIPTAGMKIACS